jgi:hypothetical protein
VTGNQRAYAPHHWALHLGRLACSRCHIEHADWEHLLDKVLGAGGDSLAADCTSVQQAVSEQVLALENLDF